jgi:hypothetical protein
MGYGAVFLGAMWPTVGKRKYFILQGHEVEESEGITIVRNVGNVSPNDTEELKLQQHRCDNPKYSKIMAASRNKFLTLCSKEIFQGPLASTHARCVFSKREGLDITTNSLTAA